MIHEIDLPGVRFCGLGTRDALCLYESHYGN